MSDEMSIDELRAYLAKQNASGKPGRVKTVLQQTQDNLNELSAHQYRQHVRQSTPARQLEHQMQVRLVKWFRSQYPALAKLLFAIPNGAKVTMLEKANGEKFSPERIRLVEEGLTPGVPDLMLALPWSGYAGLYLELKIAPNKPSPEQVAQMALLTKVGYSCHVGYTDEACQRIIRDYLTGFNQTMF